MYVFVNEMSLLCDNVLTSRNQSLVRKQRCTQTVRMGVPVLRTIQQQSPMNPPWEHQGISLQVGQSRKSDEDSHEIGSWVEPVKTPSSIKA